MVASWTPSSPDECTPMPSWNVSHTAAAFRVGRMPPQNVVSEEDHVHRRIAHVRGELLHVRDHGVGRDRQTGRLAHVAQPVHAPRRVLVVVVPQTLDGLAHPDRLGHAV